MVRASRAHNCILCREYGMYVENGIKGKSVISHKQIVFFDFHTQIDNSMQNILWTIFAALVWGPTGGSY